MRKDASGIRIETANDAARKGGVREGMRLTDARALLPTLTTQISDDRADAFMLRRLADWCGRYTPVVATDSDDGLWLDITGAAHLFGGEEPLLRDLSARLGEFGFYHRLGLAPTPGAAWAVARFCDAPVGAFADRIVEAQNGGEAPSARGDLKVRARLGHALDGLPLEALRLQQNALYLLKRFGLKTIGALREVPRTSLKRRFPGAGSPEARVNGSDLREGVLLRLDQAFGQAGEPIVGLKPAPYYFERLGFADPIAASESFHEGLGVLLKRLVLRLESDRKGALKLTFAAYHADGGLSRVAITMSRPSRSVDHILRLFRERLDTLDPGFGVDVLVLSVDAAGPLETEQLDLACDAGCETQANNDAVSELADRLSNRLGSRHVQHLVLRESHIPERAQLRVPATRTYGAKASNAYCLPDGPRLALNLRLKPPRPSFLLRQPEPIRVMAEVPEGPPRQFTWRGVTHRVLCAEGPERIAPEWWCMNECGGDAAMECTRDYYRIEDTHGQRFWVFRNGLYCANNGDDQAHEMVLPTWHMHGLFA